MSEREGFQAGVPCWVDTWQPDPEGAVGFYTGLFGWKAEPTADGDYFMCRLRGRDVTIGAHLHRRSWPAWRWQRGVLARRGQAVVWRPWFRRWRAVELSGSRIVGSEFPPPPNDERDLKR